MVNQKWIHIFVRQKRWSSLKNEKKFGKIADRPTSAESHRESEMVSKMEPLSDLKRWGGTQR